MATGQMVVENATSGAQVVHQFLFNGPLTLLEQTQALTRTAKSEGYLTSF